MGFDVELAPFALVPFALVALLALGGFLAERRRRRRKQQAYERLLARDPSLRPTATPLGLDHRTLEGRCRSLPRGDRRFGLEYGVQGPLASPVTGFDGDLDCAAFRWWWERRRSGGQQAEHSHRHRRLGTTVALVRLPAAVPVPLRLRPESPLGRLGVTRGGRQVESSEFNRRFRVECDDDRFAVMFLDAGMQALLLEQFTGRGVELAGDLLVLEGAPTHRDASLPGVVGELPAVRQDAGRLLAAVPGQVWRQLRARRTTATAVGEAERPHG
jgi:hypothetical protein